MREIKVLNKKLKKLKRPISIIVLILSFLCGVEISVAQKKAVKKNTNPAEILNRGTEAYLNYDFEEAADLMDEYRTLKNKSRQPLGEEYERLETQIQIAENAFDRVQKIIILDSINMPREDFFKAIKLRESAGSIVTPSQSKIKGIEMSQEPGFLSEEGDYYIGAFPDGLGELRLRENRRLLDGSWEAEEMLQGDFEIQGNYNYPFLGGDGQTFYYANDGEDSMGGYDIFVVQKEPITGAYLQPLNLGMPFNSPYDDFMMAIDEETGVGWWATDRNSPGEDVTIYVYLLEEIRRNYAPDTEGLEEFAKISNYKKTWEEEKEKEYQDKLKEIRTLQAVKTSKK